MTRTQERAATTAPQQPGFERRYDVQGLDAIEVEVLGTFPQSRDDDPQTYPGEPMEIVIKTDEFSPVCPWSGGRSSSSRRNSVSTRAPSVCGSWITSSPCCSASRSAFR